MILNISFLFLLSLCISSLPSYVISFSFTVTRPVPWTRRSNNDNTVKFPMKMETEKISSKFMSSTGIMRKGPSRTSSSFLQSSSVDSGEDRLPQRKPEIIGDEDIFCNRELRMDSIQAIGFDMDYTLAQYNVPFELLAYNGARDKLVDNLGYPDTVKSFEYDSTYFKRGLVIDKKRGNFLKLDRHKYVRSAYHGFDRLDTNARKELYMQSSEKMPTFSEKDFVNMDTLFLLVDAYLFAQLIDLKDKNPELITKSYEEMYKDVRASVDLCHRDGVIKDEVAKNPSAYIVDDPGMVEMLRRHKESGRKVFLVTNSLWDYTNVVMNFLNGNKDPSNLNLDWLELFDIIVVGSRKPAFLVDPNQALFRVNPNDDTLSNTEGVDTNAKEFLSTGKVFQGGNWRHLLDLLEIESGDNVMYVGDHMYSDVLKAKRTLGWRTCLVIPELDEEIRSLQANQDDDFELSELRWKRLDLDEDLDAVEMARDQAIKEDAKEEIERLDLLMEELQNESDELDDEIENLLEQLHQHFHPVWGKLFEAGFQQSRFAKQVSQYACLYTSKASNLGLVSPNRWFRVIRDVAPHETLLGISAHL